MIAAETFISRQFASHNVSRVEVIQGPGSALYGANALVGVINIITKDADKNFNKSEFGIELGSNNTFSNSYVFGFKSGDSGLSGSIRTFESDMYDFTDDINDAGEFYEITN